MKYADWYNFKRDFVELAVNDYYEVDLEYTKSVQDILLGLALKKKARLVDALRNLKGFTGDVHKRTQIPDIFELIYSAIKKYPH